MSFVLEESDFDMFMAECLAKYTPLGAWLLIKEET